MGRGGGGRVDVGGWVGVWVVVGWMGGGGRGGGGGGGGMVGHVIRLSF